MKIFQKTLIATALTCILSLGYSNELFGSQADDAQEAFNKTYPHLEKPNQIIIFGKCGKKTKI